MLGSLATRDYMLGALFANISKHYYYVHFRHVQATYQSIRRLPIREFREIGHSNSRWNFINLTRSHVMSREYAAFS